jgi:hypothetical protein
MNRVIGRGAPVGTTDGVAASVPSKAGRTTRLGSVTGLAAILLLFATPVVHADTVVFSDPFKGTGGDQVTRGFYISSCRR